MSHFSQIQPRSAMRFSGLQPQPGQGLQMPPPGWQSFQRTGAPGLPQTGYYQPSAPTGYTPGSASVTQRNWSNPMNILGGKPKWALGQSAAMPRSKIMRGGGNASTKPGSGTL